MGDIDIPTIAIVAPAVVISMCFYLIGIYLLYRGNED